TAQLRAAGMTLDSVVNVITILPNAADIAASRTARQEALGDRKQASTLIIGLANPAWKKVKAVAVARGAPRSYARPPLVWTAWAGLDAGPASVLPHVIGAKSPGAMLRFQSHIRMVASWTKAR